MDSVFQYDHPQDRSQDPKRGHTRYGNMRSQSFSQLHKPQAHVRNNTYANKTTSSRTNRISGTSSPDDATATYIDAPYFNIRMNHDQLHVDDNTKTSRQNTDKFLQVLKKKVKDPMFRSRSDFIQ